jgi:hypothetical protein
MASNAQKSHSEMGHRLSELSRDLRSLRDRTGQKLIDYLHPTKPEFPAEGTELECPSCRTKAVYMRHELRYERG